MIVSTFNNKRLQSPVTWQQFEAEYAFIVGSQHSPVYYFGGTADEYTGVSLGITATDLETLEPLTDCNTVSTTATIVPNTGLQWQI
jgi:hypothetical protein